MFPVRAGANDGAVKVAVQPDGKIVAAGYIYNSSYSYSDFTVARFNTDGTPDVSFGTNGVVYSTFDTSSYASSLLIQPDGKILIAGSLFIGGSRDFALFRFNPNGSPDLTFGANGFVTTPIDTNTNDSISAIAMQSDGKIIAAGSSDQNSSITSVFAIARYNPNGSLDSSFEGSGKTTTSFYNYDWAGNIVLRPDGRFVVVGSTYNRSTSRAAFALAQYNDNGTLDASFDGDGKVISLAPTSTEYYVTGAILQPDGKVVVSGTQYGFGGTFQIARYNPDGSPDASFDGDGRAEISFGTNGGQAWTLALQPNGKIIVGGAMVSSRFDFALARLNSDGSYDRGFGVNGRVVTTITNAEDQIYGLALQSDGKILVSGYSNGSSNSDFTLARYEGGEAAAFAIPFDFDGDGRADISVYRTNTWYIQRSQAGFAGAQWGASGDLIAPADYDGDDKTDYAVFRPTTGYWYILQSSNNQFVAVYFGTNGDLPRPADFDGDGLADVSVFRPSNGYWYRQNSSNNQFAAIKFGSAGDAPVIGDFDGDQKSDIAVFRPSNGSWYRLNSLDNKFIGLQFGANGDIPAVGDFDGDGKSDISVFRPTAGAWYRINSSNNQFVGLNFGVGEDIPTPADYDGDGKTDVSVFRPSNGHWYRQNSANNGFYAEQFGVNGDRPAPGAFNQ
ncbi:MAG TPA: FG-GAP-like repeat-containing protein [Pyrinomonadaceae bacterium]